MAGINQGRPETAIGEPIRFGDDLDFEIEQHPISDRLIIRDTANGKEAYVRADRGGTIGGDGVLIKALKEGKPVADDGRTHDTIQEAERAASSFVFVPPGTFNESVTISTDGLTVAGSGESSEILNNDTNSINLRADDVTIKSILFSSNGSGDFVSAQQTTDNLRLINCSMDGGGSIAQNNGTGGDKCLISGCSLVNGAAIGGIGWTGSIIQNCTVDGSSGDGVKVTNFDTFTGDDSIVSNCVIRNSANIGIAADAGGLIIIGNRVDNSNRGILSGDLIIVANNRVSGSAQGDIVLFNNNSVEEGNLTGPSN